MIRELNKIGFVFKTTIEEDRAKAREARLACDYDSATRQPDSKERDEEGVDQLANNAWYDVAYG